MASSQGRRWLIALLVIVVSAPVLFALGIGGAWVWQTLRGPAPGGGEGVQADAYQAVLIGGPLGLSIGSAVLGTLALKYAGTLSWTVVAALLGVLLMASAYALQVMGAA